MLFLRGANRKLYAFMEEGLPPVAWSVRRESPAGGNVRLRP